MLFVLPDAVYTLPPEKLAAARALAHTQVLAKFGGTLFTAFVLWLLIRGRAGARLRHAVRRLAGPPWLQGLVAIPPWLLVLALCGLPGALLLHRASLRFGLSVQGWPGWWADWAKSTLLLLGVGTFVLTIVYALMRHSRRHWWVWFWLLSLPLEVLAVFATPLLVDPLFNHFDHLQSYDPALATRLKEVADRGGLHIPPRRMYVMQASAKYTAPNAYVTGFGSSKRIVVWDTAIRQLPPDEILFVYGHEQGHYVLHHIWKGLLFAAALTFVLFWAAYRAVLWIVHHRGRALHIVAVDDWASLGVLLLIAVLLAFLSEPAANAFSRMEEHEADVYGQQVIAGLVASPRQTATADFQRLGELWLEDLAPNPLVVFWTYSHPPVGERKRFAATANLAAATRNSHE